MMNKHDMFVLSEGFIHETRLTSLLVCREGVSLCGRLQHNTVLPLYFYSLFRNKSQYCVSLTNSD